MKGRRSDTKDDKAVLKEQFQKIKAENRHLRKTIKQLQKEISRIRNYTFDEFEEEEPRHEPQIKKKPEVCPKCGEKIIKFEAGIFEIRKCDGCGWKKARRLTKLD